jgi:hypothetical protein
MYVPEEVDIDPINQEINRLDAQSGQLWQAIESFNEAGQTRGWNILHDQWEDLTQYKQGLEGHGQSLRLVREELSVERVTKDRTDTINKWLDDKIGQITKEINDKLRRHISKLVVANEENRLALESIVTAIGLKLPEVPPPPPSAVSLNRAIVFSLFAGAILGIISFRFSRSRDFDIIHHIWPWVFGLGIFGTIFSFVARLTKGGAVWALALGAAAGATGQLVLKLIKVWAHVDAATWQDLFPYLDNLVLGALFGASLAILTHAFRYWVRPKLQGSCKCYVSIALAGAALFVALALLTGFVSITDIRQVVFMIVLGSFVSVTVAFITNIFHAQA